MIKFNVFIVAGVVLLIIGSLAFFGVLPIPGVVNFNAPYISIKFGYPASYVRISVNGEVVLEENIGINFVSQRAVNVDPGDIVEVRVKWNPNYYGYVKINVIRLPKYNYEKGCLEIIEVGGEGMSGTRYDIGLTYKTSTWGTYSSTIWIDIPDTKTPPVPGPTTTVSPTPTYTATIISPTVTVTETYVTTTTWGTVTYTTTTTTTTTVTATETTFQPSIYSRNIVLALLFAVPGALSIAIGVRGIRW